MSDELRLPPTPAQWEALHERALKAEAACAAMREDLIWCSGSQDFAPEGQAHVGWGKVRARLDADNPGAPLLAALRQAREALDRGQHNELCDVLVAGPPLGPPKQPCSCGRDAALAAIDALGLP